MDNIYLSIVVPAYNEQNRIGKTLAELNGYLSKQNYTYEILVVNDGSKDKTTEVVSEAAKTVKNLRLIDNKENHGKGHAQPQGQQQAGQAADVAPVSGVAVGISMHHVKRTPRP